MDTIERLTKKREEIKKIMSDTTYIKWLIQFTQDKESFYDNEWSNFPEKIRESDKENVEKLGLFYEGITDYSNKNNIDPTPCDDGNYYKVKLKDFRFEIGIVAGQGVLFFFRKSSQEDDKEFIDFNDILIGKKQDDARLKSLEDLITICYETGINITAIEEAANNKIKDIKSQEAAKANAKPKTLERTNKNS